LVICYLLFDYFDIYKSRVAQGGLAHHQDYKNLFAIVKRRVDFGSAVFLTKTGKKIAARRGGIEIRRDFFRDLLAELKEYEA